MILEFDKQLAARETPIPGLIACDLTVHGDARGWFKENWQRAKMAALSPQLAAFRPVQNNMSMNDAAGVTRGFHAEPWNKLVGIASGRVFGAWVDLRRGPTFGRTFACELDPSVAVFVPRGVANAFQTLEAGTSYSYLVDAHWSPDSRSSYAYVNLADPALDIDWPIPLECAVLSDADRAHPPLADVEPISPKRTMVTGAGGQLGRAVVELAAERGLADLFDATDAGSLDLTDEAAYETIDWDAYGTVVNCAAFTAVDAAETAEGRTSAWAANATGPSLMARTCAEHGVTLVHVSTDYVFDGTAEVHAENEAFSPLSAYGQSKAAGDIAVAGCPSHYIVRSSWVVGDGKNFVETMMGLSRRCADGTDELSEVTVVDDQIGRLTFARDLAEGIFWLLGYRDGDLEPSSAAPFGTYNLTGSGAPASWAEIAARVFELTCGNAGCVRPVTTGEYLSGASGAIAPRPAHSTLALDKIEAAGFEPPSWEDRLGEYVRERR